MDARRWYLQKANAGSLSKAELLRMIESAVHMEISLDESTQDWYTKENDELPKRMQHKENLIRLIQSDDHACNEGLGKEKCGRFMLYRGPRRNMVDRAG